MRQRVENGRRMSQEHIGMIAGRS